MPSSAKAPDRPLRADAERNRERILTAAREAFAEDGLDVGLHEIARRAGVGVGTVYRRFPDKEDLIEALFQDRVAEVEALAGEALADPDGWAGLEHFLHRTCELQAADRGLHQLVFTGEKGPRCAAGARERIAPLVAQLVERAQGQGALRPDVTALDVGMLRHQLGMLIDAAGEAAPEVWPRLLRIVLDGLRRTRRAPSELPGESPGPAVFQRVMTRGKA
jgi:AcrR family transcriptional regulator